MKDTRTTSMTLTYYLEHISALLVAFLLLTLSMYFFAGIKKKHWLEIG